MRVLAGALIDGMLEATDKSKLSVVLTLRGDFFGRAVTGQREPLPSDCCCRAPRSMSAP